VKRKTSFFRYNVRMFPDFDSALAAYDYAFPPELIANAPADPRDSSRLAVLDRSTGETQWTTFRVIGEYLPPNALRACR
jgi:S-adenosylmethionine:tRNA-ribosyltransferase-isomerase (queuine synthetase)